MGLNREINLSTELGRGIKYLYTFKKFLHAAEIFVVFLLCILLAVNVFSAVDRPFTVVLAYLFFYAVCFIIIIFFRNKIFSGDIKKRIVFILIMSVFIRLPAVYFLNLTPKGDYAVYLSVARKIKNRVLDNKLYFGIFPHALNYPIFISFFYRVMGEKTWLPRVINLLFGAVEAASGSYIAEKCMNPRAGIISGLAIALNSSIIIFTLLPGGEPIYSSIIAIAVFFLALGFYSKKKDICIAAAGIVCAVANFFRPTGIILIIAYILVIFLYSNENTNVKIKQSLLLLLSFVVIVRATGFITSSVSGYGKPQYSFGWNLYIGANEETQGRWNEKDAELFNTVKNNSDDPSEIQKHFYNLGVERYKNMGIRMIPHFRKKLGVWFDESFVSEAVTGWQTQYTRFKSGDLKQTYSLIITTYNLLVVSGAIAAMLCLSLEKKAPLIMKTVSFYMAGSIMLFMVLETASRYKGAYYSVLTILAVYGYRKFFGFIRKKIFYKKKDT